MNDRIPISMMRTFLLLTSAAVATCNLRASEIELTLQTRDPQFHNNFRSVQRANLAAGIPSMKRMCLPWESAHASRAVLGADEAVALLP